VITDVSQRWTKGRVSYRPAGEPLVTSQFEIVQVREDARVKAFIEEHHYSSSFPAARFKFELWWRKPGEAQRMVGAAVFSHPSNDRVLTSVFPGAAVESVELGRLVQLDEVPGNSESYFVGHCLRELRKQGILGVVSFSDPVPRLDGDRVVLPGHVGTIYCACNALYVGRATPRTLDLFHDGTVFSARTSQKIRAQERGWAHAAQLLVDRGADRPPTSGPAIVAWLSHWKAALTTKLRHGGNLKYLFPIGGKAVERHVRAVAKVQRYLKARRDERGVLVELVW